MLHEFGQDEMLDGYLMELVQRMNDDGIAEYYCEIQLRSGQDEDDEGGDIEAIDDTEIVYSEAEARRDAWQWMVDHQEKRVTK